ncbi:MAG: 2-amino-4-hydroxy-6-hydroxymethyldihydropteridine diphosphokinase [Candidatus Omnitrophica bacterium]|nr:2-amino-4-hydroxy-6-hydroxymethyldihydropteridine diphosphokinase [Candidatus Omnitrophota bacterium]
MAIAYLSIGSNVGDKLYNCNEAIRRLQEVEGAEVLARSVLYLTKPAGGPRQEDYLNGVLKIETENPPKRLLRDVKAIENDMGRKPAPRNYPRIIDIDILLYDDLVLKTREFTIPHPRMHERKFILKGFNEIAPEEVHPVTGKTVGRMYEGLIRTAAS